MGTIMWNGMITRSLQWVDVNRHFKKTSTLEGHFEKVGQIGLDFGKVTATGAGVELFLSIITTKRIKI